MIDWIKGVWTALATLLPAVIETLQRSGRLGWFVYQRGSGFLKWVRDQLIEFACLAPEWILGLVPAGVWAILSEAPYEEVLGFFSLMAWVLPLQAMLSLWFSVVSLCATIRTVKYVARTVSFGLVK